jgi:methyl-accepting chemotaxis protein
MPRLKLHVQASKVEEGSKLVFESGQMLKEIVVSVSKVNDTVEQITLASQEQSTGIEQVNSAVIYIDKMTEKNSVMVKEATNSNDTMSTQARNYSQLVS